MTDMDSDEYDWRRRLSHINVTVSHINVTGDALRKYDWRRQLRGGGCDVY